MFNHPIGTNNAPKKKSPGMAKSPSAVQEQDMSGIEDGAENGMDGTAVAGEHGPAHEIHMTHEHEMGAHHVHSVHADGHEHHSDHASAGEAHDHAKKLAGEHESEEGYEEPGEY